MSLIKFEPNSLSSFRQDINRMFESLARGNEFETESSLNSKWKLHVDIKEDAEKFTVLADIPGVATKDIQLSIDQNILTISGTRTTEEKTESENYQRIERFSGSFERQFTLPSSIDANAIKAKSNQGVLEISIPKQERATAKFINIEE